MTDPCPAALNDQELIQIIGHADISLHSEDICAIFHGSSDLVSHNVGELWCTKNVEFLRGENRGQDEGREKWLLEIISFSHNPGTVDFP